MIITCGQNMKKHRLMKENYDKEELTDPEESVDLSNMPPLEGDEEVKEGKGIKT